MSNRVRTLSERPSAAGISDGATKNARRAGSDDQPVGETAFAAGRASTIARRYLIAVEIAGARRA